MRHRVILFHELGGAVTAMTAIVLAALGFDVRYLKLSGWLRSDRVMAYLGRRSVVALSYEGVDAAAEKNYRFLSEASNTIYQEVVRSPALESAIEKSFEMSAGDCDRFSLACAHYVLSDLNELAELAVFADEIHHACSLVSISLITTASPLSRAVVALRRREGVPVNLVPTPSFAILGYLRQGLSKYLRTIKNALTSNDETFCGEKTAKDFAMSDVDRQILYFPHKGIFYGPLFAKDHYYAADAASPFHPANILHLSLGESPEERVDSDAYYRVNGIPNTDLNALATINLRRWAADFFSLLWNHRSELLTEGGSQKVWRALFYFARYCHLRQYLSALDRLPHARIALVGYDIVFPPMLAVALGIRGITTIATQERFLSAFQKIYRLMFDHYLVMGPRVCRQLECSSHFVRIGRCEPIGPIRAELIASHIVAETPDKYKEIKKQFFLILALDWHSAPTVAENARAMTNHWQTNCRFYQDMIALARALPSAYVVIKGKEATAATLPIMSGIMDEIRRMPNISVETDIARYLPSTMAAIADLTVACHTSLVDEILTEGKLALIYDFVGFPSAFFDYDGYPIIVRSYSELLQRVAVLMQGGALMDESTFAELRRDFYSHGDGALSETPRTKLRTILDDVYRTTMRASK